MYPLSVVSFNMIEALWELIREMKEIRNTHDQARALYPEIIHPNISFCQDSTKLHQGKGNLMKYKLKSLIILSTPNRNPILLGKHISILFTCKSSLNIVITASFYFFMNTKSEPSDERNHCNPKHKSSLRACLCHAYTSNMIPNIWNLAPISKPYMLKQVL